MANYSTFADFNTQSSGAKATKGVAAASAIRAMPFTATSVASGAVDVQGIVATPGLRLCGFSIRETAGAVAAVTLRNGTLATDAVLAHVSLAANEAKTVMFGDGGIPAAAGVFCDRLSGTFEITLYTKIIL